MLTRPTNAQPSLQRLWPTLERQIKAIPGYEEASQRVARAIHQAVLGGGDPARAAADALHGTWLGHPLHAAIVHIPIGAWMLSALFDLFAVAGSRQAEGVADSLIAVGALSAVPVALAGAADYSAIPEDAAPLAATHALLNNVALGLYLLSLGARRGGNRDLGLLLSTLALGVVSASAAIGGDMVYRKRVGVDRTPEAAGPEEWEAVLSADELGIGEPRRVEVDGAPVLVYRDLDGVHAISAVCSHAGGPLEEGRFEGHCVECPWHQSVFDVRDGSVVHGPAVHAQPRYEARLRNEQLELRRWRPDRHEEQEAEVGERARALGGQAL